LGSVLIVWGIIGYRIFSAINPSTEETREQEFSVNFNPKAITELDTFSVKTVNRDPFLGTLQRNRPQRKSTGIVKTDFKWPVITYQGLVKDKNSHSGQIFVINVNGNQSLLKRGKTFSEVTLIKGNKKELTVKYKGKLKTISLKQ